MHPEQRPLEPEIEQIWLAACADARLNVNECLLYLFDGHESDAGFGGMHFNKHREIYESPDLGDDINALVPELNSAERIDATKILVWRDRTTEGLAGAIRHELEHAVQNAAHVKDVEGLYHLAHYALTVRVGDLPGGAMLYQTIPNELDANAAAAVFVRGRYGADRVRALLAARDNDSALFRSLVGPAPVESLPERLMGFFLMYRDLCEEYARSQRLGFPQLLNLHWQGAGQLWRQLVDQGDFELPR
jgi:hypothetical protein